MSKAKSFLDLGLADTTPHPLYIEVENASGVWINTKDGKRLFDAISGIGVSNFGHGNKEITERLHSQIDSNLHTMVYGEFISPSTAEAAALLASLLPQNLNTTYFTNSGAEAIEGALKLAKKATGRTRIIACNGGYHGNTTGALSVSSNEERKSPFLPLLPDVSFIDYNYLESLSNIDSNTACVVVETIQGDAGVQIPSSEWMLALRIRCDESGALLVLDEVQCGIGRTGKSFAFEHFQIVPDILCLGKALGGGVPIGAFISSKQLMAQLSNSPKLGHITTFGGNPLATSGAVGALNLLKRVDYDKVEQQGAMWERKLLAHNSVKEIRRKGLFFCVELDSELAATQTIKNGLENGVLMFWFLSLPNAFRLSPPLNMTDDEACEGIELILKSLPL